MRKVKTQFVCTECGSISSRWFGKCPQCGNWNTLEEAPVPSRNTSSRQVLPRHGTSAKLCSLSDVEMASLIRMEIGIAELDRVLGGGIVLGSLILLSGDPGIGKSTLVLQMAASVANKGKVMYSSGEESAGQIKLRAERLGITSSAIMVQSDISLDMILQTAIRLRPALLIVDSIQTMYTEDCEGAPGSLSQIRECTVKLMGFAKTENISVLVIGHVTKEGTIAGPRVMEHMVDVVLHFEGEKNYQFRVLRGIKNRFGSTSESGLFTMTEKGLQEVRNPSQLLLAERTQVYPGAVITAVMDGVRPLLCEIQALTTHSIFSVPRRTASGMDYNRLIILLAVLEKQLGLRLGSYDVYVNMVGGLKISETAADLATLMSIYSALRDTPLDRNTVVMGEVGLTGDIRRIPHVLRRIQEGITLGFTTYILPYGNRDDIMKQGVSSCKIYPVKTIQEAVQIAFSSE